MIVAATEIIRYFLIEKFRKDWIGNCIDDNEWDTENPIHGEYISNNTQKGKEECEVNNCLSS